MWKSGLAKGRSPSTSIVLILILLALMAVLGLDYVQYTKGARSHIFARLLPSRQPASPEEALARSLVKALASQEVRGRSVKEGRDATGRLNLRIDLVQSRYDAIEAFLLKELAALNAAVLVKKEEPVETAIVRRWDIEGREGGRLEIVFRCRPDEPKPRAAEKPPAVPRGRNRAALIIDDMGNSLQAISDICALARPLTVAVLPMSPFAKETAAKARACGLDVILHLPLESVANHEGGSDGNGFILAGMSEAQVRATFDDMLSRVPGVDGANNHMGSRITADEPMMKFILSLFKERGLFFIDSRTSGRSLAYELALGMNVPSAYRDVFLDADGAASDVKAQFFEFLRLARRKDGAIAIGHPFENTLRTLKSLLPLLDVYGVELVPASRIVRR
jgi:polysaccharide deacetylase 2 family uncharacterized protein YibQ